MVKPVQPNNEPHATATVGTVIGAMGDVYGAGMSYLFKDPVFTDTAAKITRAYFTEGIPIIFGLVGNSCQTTFDHAVIETALDYGISKAVELSIGWPATPILLASKIAAHNRDNVWRFYRHACDIGDADAAAEFTAVVEIGYSVYCRFKLLKETTKQALADIKSQPPYLLMYIIGIDNTLLYSVGRRIIEHDINAIRNFVAKIKPTTEPSILLVKTDGHSHQLKSQPLFSSAALYADNFLGFPRPTTSTNFNSWLTQPTNIVSDPARLALVSNGLLFPQNTDSSFNPPTWRSFNTPVNPNLHTITPNTRISTWHKLNHQPLLSSDYTDMTTPADTSYQFSSSGLNIEFPLGNNFDGSLNIPLPTIVMAAKTGLNVLKAIDHWCNAPQSARDREKLHTELYNMWKAVDKEQRPSFDPLSWFPYPFQTWPEKKQELISTSQELKQTVYTDARDDATILLTVLADKVFCEKQANNLPLSDNLPLLRKYKKFRYYYYNEDSRPGMEAKNQKCAAKSLIKIRNMLIKEYNQYHFRFDAATSNDEALQIALNFAAIAPHNPSAHLMLSQAYSARGLSANASEHAAKAQAYANYLEQYAVQHIPCNNEANECGVRETFLSGIISENDKQLANAQVSVCFHQEARDLYTAGKYAKAISKYNFVPASNRQADDLKAMGLAHQALNNSDEAIKHFHAYIETTETNESTSTTERRAIFSIAATLHGVENRESWLNFLNNRPKNDHDALLFLAEAQTNNNQLNTALNLLNNLLTAQPSDIAALRLRSRIQIQKDGSSAAITDLETIVSLDPNDHASKMLLGNLYSRRMDVVSAEKCYQEVADNSTNSEEKAAATMQLETLQRQTKTMVCDELIRGGCRIASSLITLGLYARRARTDEHTLDIDPFNQKAPRAQTKEVKFNF
ncbi:MAG: tetratricopeptide repeat protein [Gammaproteobacteria bacterium]|nr:tetratricopeptide repeat protein [Gammaproteobacteria bacterium]